MPEDYAIILIPLILFGFLDMYIEGGFYSGIVKKGITQSQERDINERQFKQVALLGLIMLASLILFSYVNTNLEIPILVIFSYFLTSVVRVFIFTKEAVFVAVGRYIFVETMSFIATCIIYSIVFLSIYLSDVSGYYYLCIWHLGFVLIYASIIQVTGSGLETSENVNTLELEKFSKTNRNSSIIFTISGRLDELSASIIYAPASLGLFSKIKEIAIMLGTFSSKIISRPWFYIACNSEQKFVATFHTLSMLIIILGSWLLMPIIEFIIGSMIDVMGKNWTDLNYFSEYLIIIFIIYLCTEFTRCTLVATGGENFVLRLEKYFFLIRLFVYPLLLVLVNLDYLNQDIKNILLLEVCIRISYFSLQTIYLIIKLIKERPVL